MKSVRKLGNEFIESTTLQPLAEIKKAPLPAFKVGWVFAFAIASYFLIDHVYGLIVEYRKYAVNINVKEKPKEMLPFPSVTVCNLNNLKKDELVCSPFRSLATLNEEIIDTSKCPNTSDMSRVLGINDWSGAGDDFSGLSGSGEWYDDSTELSGSGDSGSGYWSGTSGFSSGSGYSGSGESGDWSGTSDFSTGSDYSVSSYPDYSQWASYDYDYSSGSTSAYYYSYSGSGKIHVATEFNKISSIKDKLVNSTTDNVFHTLLTATDTGDLSDVRGIVTFSPEDSLKYGYSKEEMIVQCSIDRGPCNHSDFARFYSTYYSNCYTFNTAVGFESSPWMTRRSGYQDGLRLLLNINASQYNGFLASEYGIRIAISSPYSVPRPENTGVNVSPGSKVTIGIKANGVYRHRAPYESNCTNEIPLKLPINQTAFPSHAEYTIEDCRAACYQAHLYNCCQCVLEESTFRAMNSSNLTYTQFSVFNQTHLDCKFEIDRRLVSRDDQNRIVCDCPPPCQSWHLKQVVYTTPFPSEPYLETLVTHFNSHTFLPGIAADTFNGIKNSPEKYHIAKTFMQDNIASVQVYYETLTTTVWTEETAYTFRGAFGDVGGTMGIYMGLTIVTLLEVVQFLLTQICIICAGKGRNRIDQEVF